MDVVQLLLEAGAEKDANDSDGCTALMAAACSGFAEVVQLLLDAGAQKDLRDSVGRTALINAAGYGHFSVVRVLLEAHAHTEFCDNSGNTALILGSPECTLSPFVRVPLRKPSSRKRIPLLLRGYWGTLSRVL